MAAAEAALSGPTAVVVVGPAGPSGTPWRQTLAGSSTEPGRVVLVAEPGSDALPILLDRPLVDDRPTAYVCRDLVCELPVTEFR